MLVRNCAGGVVFLGEKVLLLKTEKGEWVLPKGVIHGSDLSSEVALKRVREEAGVSAEIISAVGRTNYEYYSVTRQKPVCNKITWYIMKSLNENIQVNKEEEFISGGFYELGDAIDLITYSQDKSIINLSFQKFRELA